MGTGPINFNFSMKNSNSKSFSFRSFGKAGNPVIFLYTAFRTRYWLYYPTIRKLVKEGYYVVVYDFNPTLVFKGEVSDLLNLANDILKNTKNQVEEFKKDGVKKFFAFGVSMGTIMGLRAAIEIPEIKKVVVNLTYGSLADTIWTQKVLGKIKKRFQKSGITKEKLELLLEPISPLSMARKLKGKKVLLYLSKKDKVILFSQSSEFKKALEEAKVDYVYRENQKFGHIISGFLNNARARTYLDFLK